MRVFQKTFTFSRNRNACNLAITLPWGRVRDYDYPISYTIEDCLEDWCAGRGENFISFEITRRRRVFTAGKFKYHGKIRNFKKAGRKQPGAP